MIKTFQASPEVMKFILKTKNTEAAQAQKCENCGDAWKDHWAGKSTSIPQGACTKFLEITYEGK